MAEISLFVIVGDPLKMKTPPPARTSLASLNERNTPPPPVMRKPSRRSAFEAPAPQTTVEQICYSEFGTQASEMQGRSVPSIVVTADPLVEMTLIPAKIRIDSL